MTQKELAEALGISQAAVSKLVRRGMPSDTVERASRWRRRHLQTGRMKGIRRDTQPSQQPSTAGATVEQPTAPEDVDLFDPDRDDEEAGVQAYRDARDRKEHYQAEMARIAYEKETGELLRTADVVAVIANAATTMRTSLEALPAQLAPALAGRSENHIQAALASEIERTLENLSRGFAALSHTQEPRSQHADT